MTSTPLIDKARAAAADALKDYTRHDGTPFIGHPDAVAQIVADEIGLPEELLAKLASGFAGGGGTREGVCGALNGAVMALDLLGII